MDEPAETGGTELAAREYAARLLFAVEHFRKGEDQTALDYLDDSMEWFGRLLEDPDFVRHKGMAYREILPALRSVLECIRSEDIAGLTDWLEFAFYPAAQTFLEGWDELRRSPGKTKPGKCTAKT